MKICLDGMALNYLMNTGLYTYTYELINHLLHIYPQGKYEVLMDKNEERCSLVKHRKLKWIYMGNDRKNNDYTMLVDHIRRDHIHIYHSVNNGFSIPKEKVCKYISTIHNLLPVSKAEYVDTKYFNKFMNVFPNALERADKIIAVSNFIKDELMHHYKVAENKIKVIYPICSNQFKPLDLEESKRKIKKHYKIEGDYLLHVGSIHMRKNIPTIFRAFKEVLKSYKDLTLLMIGDYEGKREGYYLKLKEYAKSLNIDENVLFLGKVSYEHMLYFYNGAKCMINISSYEGFPLSVVEAMACNTPIVCTKNSSFGEALGKAAIWIDLKDIHLMKDILLEVLSNENFTINYIGEGKAQKTKYESQGIVKDMVRLYEDIV
ncbi:MAG: glycosyltransferase family 4 protein [Marinisporobacter sp.]|jgi:glycosyltransferase involved in cell wall biosynthesis|nr:glycosyltransferase family 4 protein [Marinisporobacter sp.]